MEFEIDDDPQGEPNYDLRAEVSQKSDDHIASLDAVSAANGAGQEDGLAKQVKQLA